MLCVYAEIDGWPVSTLQFHVIAAMWLFVVSIAIADFRARRLEART